MVDNSLPVTLSNLVASAVFTSVVFAFKFKVDVTSAEFAFKSNAVCAAVDTGLFASLVLSTFPKPTIVLVTPLTVPVNVGEAKFAFKLSAVFTSEVLALSASAEFVASALKS